MQYLDTGFGHPDQTLGVWLEDSLVAGAQGLWIQSGYFGFESLAIHTTAIRAIAEQGHPAHIVLGANQGSLAADDLRRILDALDGTPDGSITVVSYSNALFHPKTYVVRGPGDSYRAYVGSANMTGPGVGLNVEAGIALSTDDGDDLGQVGLIIASIESWPGRDQDGVFRVQTTEDIAELVAAGIVSLASPRFTRKKTTKTGDAASTPQRGAGRRLNLYPTAPLAPFTPPEEATPADTSDVALAWSKVLQSSDAQQVGANTNPTGKLRLAKAGHDIDHKTWFREVFFDGAQWTTEMRGNRPYEVATVPFEVTIDGASMGVKNLVVDHAPHRVADQNNVPTVLAWGHDIGRVLVGTSHVGDSVTLEKTVEGTFKLTIA
ncbi:MAG: phospholipase D family protein [Actinomycetota bacterium]|nr:phospholipase D family protein [Actinomycetota bacterium]